MAKILKRTLGCVLFFSEISYNSSVLLLFILKVLDVSENQVGKVVKQRNYDLITTSLSILLVDRVLDYKEGEWLKAIKNISVNEPCFTGHFPGEPILPGVLILEALAQSMGILAFKTHELKGGELFYFAGIDEGVSNAQYYLEIKWN